MSISKEVDKDFFKKWSAEMAYVVGFFMADGNLSINKNGGCYFSIEVCDKDILQKIRLLMKSDHKISERKSRSEKHKKIYRIQIGSREIYSDLSKIGVFQNKTFRLVVPRVPCDYFGDFLRGYFDGDGNIWMGEVHKGRKTRHIAILVGFTSGCRSFLEDLHRCLLGRGVVGGSLSKKERGYSLKYSIKDSLQIYKIMYYSVTNGLYLLRKKVVFDNFLKHMEQM